MTDDAPPYAIAPTPALAEAVASARRGPAPKLPFPDVHLLLGTPAKSPPAWGYVLSLLALQGQCGRNVGMFSYTRSAARTCPEARAEITRFAIDVQATHLLFVDADIQFPVELVWKLLALDLPLVGCSYPLRDTTAELLRLSIKPLEDDPHPKVDERGCVRVQSLGLGFTLIKVQDVLVKMEEHYAAELGHKDNHSGRMLVNLFHEPILNGALIGEDFVFFDRWRALGGEVQCYLDGDLTHHIGAPMRVNAKDYVGGPPPGAVP